MTTLKRFLHPAWALLLLLPAFAALSPAMAAPGKTVQAQNIAATEKSFAAWGKGTGSPYDLLADDAKWTIAGHSAVSRTYTSREDFLSVVIRPFGARMAGPLKPTIKRIYTDGDTVIVYFDAKGTARDGKPYANSYAWFLTMRGGKIVEAVAFFDSIDFNDFWQRVKPAPQK
jgi:uncharacterized protein